jgi:hypothetical protein
MPSPFESGNVEGLKPTPRPDNAALRAHVCSDSSGIEVKLWDKSPSSQSGQPAGDLFGAAAEALVVV